MKYWNEILLTLALTLLFYVVLDSVGFYKESLKVGDCVRYMGHTVKNKVAVVQNGLVELQEIGSIHLNVAREEALVKVGCE